jgi:hypothetical protein
VSLHVNGDNRNSLTLEVKAMEAKRLGSILLMALSTLFIYSCKKKNEAPHPEGVVTAKGTFRAKVNGVTKSFGTNCFIVSGGVGTTITGSAAGGISITLAFFSTTLGTYDVDGTLTQAYYYVGSTQHTASNGKIIITKVEDNKISGTFYFEEAAGVKVTEGTFTDVLKNTLDIL